MKTTAVPEEESHADSKDTRVLDFTNPKVKKEIQAFNENLARDSNWRSRTPIPYQSDME